MTKGCKIWLWIILVVNSLTALMGLATMSISVGAGLWTIFIEAVAITGISLMLFKQKRMGFYIMVAAVIVTLFVNLAQHINPAMALVSAIISPSITYYFISKSGMININLANGFSGIVQDVVAAFTNDNGTSTPLVQQRNTTQSSTTTAAQSANGQSDTGAASQSSNSSASQTYTTNSSASTSTGNVYSASQSDVSVDLYKELELDRSWDIKTIQQRLKQLQKMWMRRQSSTTDTDQLKLITTVMNNIENAFKCFRKEAKRKAYDLALDQAYKAGRIKDEIAEKLNTILDKARAYYRKGNIQFATQFAQEAVDGKINDPDAYELLAVCHHTAGEYEKAVEAVDQGLEIFSDNVKLTWLGARINTYGLKDYDEAQRRINRLIEIAPNNSLGYSEQVYMHLRKNEEALAFQEIDAYIAAHPDDTQYNKTVAYDLDEYSNDCFYHEEATDSYFIADKDAYDKCVKLRRKACEIYSDEITQERLARAEFYGQKEFDDWNMESVKGLAIFGGIFVLLGMASPAFMVIGLLLLAAMGGLIYYSFRPYWQINKTYVTGQTGTGETIAHEAGPVLVRTARITLQIVGKLVVGMIKLALWLASGGPFR